MIKALEALAITAAVLIVAWAIEETREMYPRAFKRCCLALLGCAVILGLVLLTLHFAQARDDGRYASSPLKSWFDNLKSGKGLCCSLTDGFTVQDPDWDSKDGHYRVHLDGRWIDVPDDAVITEPNRAGQTMVWPLRGIDGLTIRCFMPGSMG